MATKIRLQRHGKKGKAFYHVVAADSRAKRDGKFIEKLGTYNPNTNPATIELNFDRTLHWVQVGAEMTDTARAILSYKGILYKNHLLNGVKKGALTEEQVEERFNKWLEEKEAKVQGKVDSLAKDAEQKRAERLKAETELNEARAKEIAAKNTPEVEVTEDAATEEAVTEEPTEETAAEEVKAADEPVETPVKEEEPAEEPAKEEAPAETEVKAEEEKKEEPAKEEASEEVKAEEEAPAEEEKKDVSDETEVKSEE